MTAGEMVAEGAELWRPGPARVARANITRFLDWLNLRGRAFSDYHALWRWSVDDTGAFWGAVWDYFDMGSRPADVLPDDRMPGAVWFPGTKVNYAATLFARAPSDGRTLAILAEDEAGGVESLDWDTLRDRVGRARQGLSRLGVGRGDRVAAYLPNIPEAVVAFLATASLGAIWTCCSPDFGVSGVVDRFRQVEPTVLIAVDGYRYGGREYDRRDVVDRLRGALPTVRTTVMVARIHRPAPMAPDRTSWQDLCREEGPLEFERVPFDHPLWILYSSGTTGLPKPIVQSHGGILLTNLINGHVHMDLSPASRFFWFTTTGWMMWNTLVSGLLAPCPIVLYDGSPTYGGPDRLYRLVDRHAVTFFGTSAAFLAASEKAGITPGDTYGLDALESIGSTGSPLAPSQFAWVYHSVKRDVWLTSASGGTDVCTKLVGGVPTLPVGAGELQCRCLGMSVEAYDEAGRSVVDDVGELVITRPVPSMPVTFWNDPGGHRYHAAYFERYPGVWHHGDWIKIKANGAVVIYGRSDATINRHGVRIGSAEIYRVVEAFEEVEESLVVDLEYRGRPSTLALFVKPAAGASVDSALVGRLRTALAKELSPRHVPDVVLPVGAVPRTLNGKKLEVPIRRVLLGMPPEQAFTRSSVQNPDALTPFLAWARDGLPKG